MPFDFVQYDTFTRKWEKSMKGVGNLKQEFLYDQAESFLKKCKEVTPVISGNLRDHWYISDFKLGKKYSEIHVDNDALNTQGEPYASYVEDGFTHWITDQWIEGQHMSQIAAGYLNSKIRHRWTDKYRRWLKSKGLW